MAMLPWIRYVVHVPFEFRSFVEGVPVTPKNSRFLLLSSELSLPVFRESCNPLAGWVDLYRKARRERKSFPLHVFAASHDHEKDMTCRKRHDLPHALCALHVPRYYVLEYMYY